MNNFDAMTQQFFLVNPLSKARFKLCLAQGDQMLLLKNRPMTTKNRPKSRPNAFCYI
jgi:hypothetical protein